MNFSATNNIPSDTTLHCAAAAATSTVIPAVPLQSTGTAAAADSEVQY